MVRRLLILGCLILTITSVTLAQTNDQTTEESASSAPTPSSAPDDAATNEPSPTDNVTEDLNEDTTELPTDEGDDGEHDSLTPADTSEDTTPHPLTIQPVEIEFDSDDGNFSFSSASSPAPVEDDSTVGVSEESDENSTSSSTVAPAVTEELTTGNPLTDFSSSTETMFVSTTTTTPNGETSESSLGPSVLITSSVDDDDESTSPGNETAILVDDDDDVNPLQNTSSSPEDMSEAVTNSSESSITAFPEISSIPVSEETINPDTTNTKLHSETTDQHDPTTDNPLTPITTHTSNDTSSEAMYDVTSPPPPPTDSSTATTAPVTKTTDIGGSTSSIMRSCFGEEAMNVAVLVGVVVLINLLAIILTAFCVHRIVSRRRSWDPPPIYFNRSRRGVPARDDPAGLNLASDSDCRAGEGGNPVSHIPIVITNEDGWCVPYSEKDPKKKKAAGGATEDTGV